MKIVILDHPRENSGEINWSEFDQYGEVIKYARTLPEQVVERIGDAEIVFLNKTVITKEDLEKCPNLVFISVDGVIIINNSRGALIVEEDLAEALNSGKIYAAGLDVVRNEPVSMDNPLLKAKNCYITPHISWAAVECRQRLIDYSLG